MTLTAIELLYSAITSAADTIAVLLTVLTGGRLPWLDSSDDESASEESSLEEEELVLLLLLLLFLMLLVSAGESPTSLRADLP
jgi:hypothetical protein